MEIQHMIPSPAITITSYTAVASTDHRFTNFFYSAPTSPILSGFQTDNDDDGNDFAFDFSGQREPPSMSDAGELFYGGKFKILNHLSDDQPKSSKSRFKDAFSPKFGGQSQPTQNPPKRGRETTTGSTRIRGKVSRSSSPFRISDILSEQQDNNQKHSLSWYNKWNLKNLLLFRSTSEGSARRRKDPVNKYARIRTTDEDVKNSSFRSTDSFSSGVGSSCRRVTRKVSAHEIHYTANRAVAEEMRWKTYLPYKSGLLGCLRFRNNGGGSVHEISSSVMKQRRV